MTTTPLGESMSVIRMAEQALREILGRMQGPMARMEARCKVDLCRDHEAVRAFRSTMESLGSLQADLARAALASAPSPATTTYSTCERCNGTALVINDAGEPDDCTRCSNGVCTSPATTPGDARDAAIEECVAECDRIAMDLDSRADALNVQGLTRLAECRAEEAARVRYVRDRIAALSSPPSPSDTPRES